MAARKKKVRPAPKGRQLIFRDAKGRFIKNADRYTPKVKSVQAKRRNEDGDVIWQTIAKGGKMTPKRLAELTKRDEFESMPEARRPAGTFTSKKKYKAWDIAEQIDSARGMRNKLLRITMDVMDGERMRKVVLYHIINTNKKRSYQIFQRMNSALGMEGMNLYSTLGGRSLPDRKGTVVKLKAVHVEEVI